MLHATNITVGQGLQSYLKNKSGTKIFETRSATTDSLIKISCTGS